MLAFNLILVIAFLSVSCALLAVLAFSLTRRAVEAWLTASPKDHAAHTAFAAVAVSAP
jgi:hypothetical protein